MARPRKQQAMTPEARLEAAQVPVEEQPYPLPEGWKWVRLGLLVTASKEKTEDFSSPSLRYVGLEHIAKDGDIVEYATASGLKSLKNVFHEGQILYGKLRPYLNKHGIAKCSGVCSTDILVFNCTNKSINRFVNYFFDIDYFREYVAVNSKGINLPRVSENVILHVAAPLPPLAEQKRIVSRIESFFARLDEARAKAQAVLDSFEARRAAILHKAFSGELTQQWRREHGLALESWEKKSFDDIIASIEAGKNFRCEERPPEEGECGIVKVSAVTWGGFNELESKTCHNNNFLDVNIMIKNGDFLFSRANTVQLVGKCVVVDNIKKKLMLSDKILRIVFKNNILKKYVLFFTESMRYREQIEGLASGNQDGMRNISQKNLRKVSISVPTQEEQNKLIKILDKLYTKEQQAMDIAKAVLRQIDLMKKAILAKAFRGELGKES